MAALVHTSRYHLAGPLLPSTPMLVGRGNSSRPSECKEGGGLSGKAVPKDRGSNGGAVHLREHFIEIWVVDIQTHSIGRELKRSSSPTIRAQSRILHAVPNDLCLKTSNYGALIIS